MTAVEEIRRAAALMRERAQAATPGPWADLVGQRESSVEQLRGEHTITDVQGCEEHPGRHGPDAEHIASWHPLVTLAVADWLDNEALTAMTVSWAHIDHELAFGSALAVARAYLDGAP